MTYTKLLMHIKQKVALTYLFFQKEKVTFMKTKIKISKKSTHKIFYFTFLILAYSLDILYFRKKLKSS